MTWTYEPIEQTWSQLVQDTRPNGARFYVSHAPDRPRRYPSVTTVLSATDPPEHKNAIERWRIRVGTPVADYIVKQAQQTGTDSHAHMERLLQNPNLLGQIATHRTPFVIQGHVRNLSAFAISKIRKVLATETFVFSDRDKVAGACDALVIDDNDELAVVDWKCLSHSRNIRPSYMLQATLYAHMFEECWFNAGSPRYVDKFYVACSIADTGDLIVREGLPGALRKEARDRVRQYWDRPRGRMVLH